MHFIKADNGVNVPYLYIEGHQLFKRDQHKPGISREIFTQVRMKDVSAGQRLGDDEKEEEGEEEEEKKKKKKKKKTKIGWGLAA